MKTAPLFRGKRVDNGEMVTGSLHVENSIAYVIPKGLAFIFGGSCRDLIPVNPDTVEQIAGDMVDEVNALREQITDNPFCSQCPYFESKDCQVRADETCHWTRDMHEHTSKTHEDAPQSTNDHQDG